MKVSRVAWVGLFVLGLFPACGDPCQDLANNICNCYPSVAQRTACTTKVSALVGQRVPEKNANTEKAGRNYCASLIDTCQCENLANGDFKACGLSIE